MVSIDLGDGFRAVPQNAVCLNGMALPQINTATEPYSGRWCLVAPNGYAVDNEFCRPYVYADLDEAKEDKASLVKMGEYSTCGGVRWKFLMESVNEPLTQEELNAGWHWCQCWDDLLVGPGMEMELEHCHCFKSPKPEIDDD